jgi:hypothetical protein
LAQGRRRARCRPFVLASGQWRCESLLGHHPVHCHTAPRPCIVAQPSRRAMQALRIALLAVLATLLLAGLGLVLAQVPDCTTSRCLYLPLIVKPEPTPSPAACTPVPTTTEVSLATDTPIVVSRAAPAASARICTPLPTATTEGPPATETITATATATPTVLARRSDVLAKR